MRIKWLGITLIFILLSGCSLLEKADNSMNYTEQATSFVNEMAQFASSIPDLVKEAANDSHAKEQLIKQLDSMKALITDFNGLEAPAFAQNIHKTLTGYNETLSKQIDEYNEQIQNGVTELKNNEMVQTLNKIQETIDQINILTP